MSFYHSRPRPVAAMRRITIDPDRTAADDVVRSLQFSPDGKLLGGVLGVRGREDVRAWRYDLDRDEPLPNPDDEDYTIELEVGAPDPVWSADLEVRAEYLLDGRGHPGLRLMDLWSKSQDTAWLTFGEVLAPTAFAFSPDGRDLYVACSGDLRYPVARWSVEQLLAGADPADADADEIDPGLDGSVSALALGANSVWLACGHFDNGVDLIDPTGELRRRRLQPRSHSREGPVYAMEFSPRGDRLAVTSWANLTVWDVESREMVFGSPPRVVTAAAFRPDGGLLAATASGDVLFYDSACAEVRRLDFGVGPLHGVAVAADGLTAAVGAVGGQVVIFDLD